MATYVRYGPEDRTIDLASLSAADYQLIASLHGNIRSGDGTLICLQRTAGNGEMLIVGPDGRYFARHFAGGAHDSHAVALMSEDHKRVQEYMQRAAQHGGYEARMEVSTGNGTRLDVAINGPVKTGIEIQHSPLPLPQVKSRTTKSFRAGYMTFWFSDAERPPAWFRAVPAVGHSPRLNWAEFMPKPRSATAINLKEVEAVRCVVGAFDPCPLGYRRPCGQFHPKLVPWGGQTIDDVAVLVPAGEAVPLQGRNGFVHLVPPSSVSLYREMTGLSGAYEPGGAPRPKRASSRRSKECSSPVHDGQMPVVLIAGRECAALICRVCDQLVPEVVAYGGCHMMCGPVA